MVCVHGRGRDRPTAAAAAHHSAFLCVYAATGRRDRRSGRTLPHTRGVCACTPLLSEAMVRVPEARDRQSGAFPLSGARTAVVLLPVDFNFLYWSVHAYEDRSRSFKMNLCFWKKSYAHCSIHSHGMAHVTPYTAHPAQTRHRTSLGPKSGVEPTVHWVRNQASRMTEKIAGTSPNGPNHQ